VAFVVFLFIPDVGAILVMASVALIMTWYAGAKLKHLAVICASGLIISLSIISLFPSKFGYITERLDFFVSEKSEESLRDVGYQTQQ
jgi:cell division protein FtsW (lipid II flippase)